MICRAVYCTETCAACPIQALLGNACKGCINASSVPNLSLVPETVHSPLAFFPVRLFLSSKMCLTLSILLCCVHDPIFPGLKADSIHRKDPHIACCRLSLRLFLRSYTPALTHAHSMQHSLLPPPLSHRSFRPWPRPLTARPVIFRALSIFL